MAKRAVGGGAPGSLGSVEVGHRVLLDGESSGRWECWRGLVVIALAQWAWAVR